MCLFVCSKNKIFYIDETAWVYPFLPRDYYELDCFSHSCFSISLHICLSEVSFYTVINFVLRTAFYSFYSSACFFLWIVIFKFTCIDTRSFKLHSILDVRISAVFPVSFGWIFRLFSIFAIANCALVAFLQHNIVKVGSLGFGSLHSFKIHWILPH